MMAEAVFLPPGEALWLQMELEPEATSHSLQGASRCWKPEICACAGGAHGRLEGAQGAVVASGCQQDRGSPKAPLRTGACRAHLRLCPAPSTTWTCLRATSTL